MSVRLLFSVSLLCAPFIHGPIIHAQLAGNNAVVDENEEVDLEAKVLEYDGQKNQLIASDSVVLVHLGQRLTTDRLTYYLETDRVQAQGNIILIDKDGNKLYAESMDLTDSFKNAVIKKLLLKLEPNGTLSADEARRIDGKTLLAQNAMYTTCECSKDKPRPLWRFRSKNARLNEEKERLYLKNTTFDVLGVPVAYLPYFSLPAPGVKRQSGFLSPYLTSSNTLGVVFGLPYYYVLSPSADLEIEPRYHSNAGLLLRGQYRKAFSQGLVTVNGSLGRLTQATYNQDTDTILEETKPSGHIDVLGTFKTKNDWRWGFRYRYSTHVNYLRYYDLTSAASQRSYIYLQKTDQNSFFNIEAFGYQSLTETVPNSRFPIVLPNVHFYRDQTFDSWGGIRWQSDSRITILSRDEGRDYERLGTYNRLSKKFNGPLYGTYTLTGSLYANFYHVSDVNLNSDEVFPTTSQTYSGSTSRILPRISLDARFPFVKRSGNFEHVIEPRLQASYASSLKENNKIPNEDSGELRFDTTNLFDENRFSGFDLLESGSRVDYGISWSMYHHKRLAAYAFIGQSIRSKSALSYSQKSGFYNHRSDWVGRFEIYPLKGLDLSYGVRFDPHEMTARQHELDFNFAWKSFDLGLGYVYADVFDDRSARNELQLRAGYKVNDNWRVFAKMVRDVEEQKTLSSEVGFDYEGLCLNSRFSVERSQYTEGGLEPETKYSFSIRLKP